MEGFRARAEGIAQTFGCGVEVSSTDRAYDEMRTNETLADAYRRNLLDLDVEVVDTPRENMGSLDMGNVSQVVPSLHPFFAIVPPGVASHTRAFARASISEAGEDGLARSVQALAMTGVDILCDDRLLQRAWEEHGPRPSPAPVGEGS